ncbi:MAG: hypothetical protein QOE31_1222, partial [Solirubrobacteraceae bacterium]|nr:hypothetical protein [Solirubrobacteraceae bacterium]
MLRVNAESAYPTITPGARVRVAAFEPFLREQQIDMTFMSHLSDDEYRALGAGAGR